MRSLFPGHYRLTEDDQKRLWQEAFIALDTNVLLDVYRVSPPTASELLKTLERLEPRLWLPYQVAREYHNRLEGVIADQAKPYDEATKILEELIQSLKNPRRHPFIEDPLLSELERLGDRIQAELARQKTRIFELLGANPLKDRIAGIIGDKVGPAPTSEELTELCAEGKQRFEASVPPGYADMKDKPEPQRYGDFILWKQLLVRMKETRKSAILITGDVKEDWFLRIAGRTLGPRPELIAEAKALTGLDVHIYQTPAFLHMVAKQLGEAVKKEAIEEVQDLERQRVESIQHRKARMNAAMRHIEAALPGARVVRMLPYGRGGVTTFILEDGRRVRMKLDEPSEFTVLEPARAQRPTSERELIERERLLLHRLSEEARRAGLATPEQQAEALARERRLLEMVDEQARRAGLAEPNDQTRENR